MTLPTAYERPYLYPKQVAALFGPTRFAVVEAATKTGKTTGALAWLVEQALVGPGPATEFWWVAPSTGQTRMAFTRLRGMLPPHVGQARSSNPPSITLPNGRVMRFRTGEKPDLLYGEDVGAAVLDEYTRMREETWWAVQTTVTATNGPVRLIGNVQGTGGWGFRLAREAEAGRDDWHYARLTWQDGVAAGVISADTVERARRQMPAAVFRELYDARATDDDTHPIGLAKIEACATLEGPVETAPLVWGWDLGRYRSWTAGVALDAQGRVCRLERFRCDWPRTIERMVQATGPAVALIDATHGSVGDVIVPLLQQEGPAGRFVPFQFTPQSRETLLNELAVTIQRREVQFPRDGELRAELEALEWQATTRQPWRYGFPDGMTGDLVMALGLAVRQLTHTANERETGGGASIVVDGETFEDKIWRNGGNWFPGD